jgi:hypothetical protein
MARNRSAPDHDQRFVTDFITPDERQEARLSFPPGEESQSRAPIAPKLHVWRQRSDPDSDGDIARGSRRFSDELGRVEAGASRGGRNE